MTYNNWFCLMNPAEKKLVNYNAIRLHIWWQISDRRIHILYLREVDAFKYCCEWKPVDFLSASHASNNPLKPRQRIRKHYVRSWRLSYIPPRYDTHTGKTAAAIYVNHVGKFSGDPCVFHTWHARSDVSASGTGNSFAYMIRAMLSMRWLYKA